MYRSHGQKMAFSTSLCSISTAYLHTGFPSLALNVSLSADRAWNSKFFFNCSVKEGRGRQWTTFLVHRLSSSSFTRSLLSKIHRTLHPIILLPHCSLALSPLAQLLTVYLSIDCEAGSKRIQYCPVLPVWVNNSRYKFTFCSLHKTWRAHLRAKVSVAMAMQEANRME